MPSPPPKPPRKFSFSQALLTPFLFSVYPVFTLFVSNAHIVGLSEIRRALAAATGLGIVAFFVGLAVLRSREKAAIETTVFLMLFFAHGHVANFLEDNSSSDFGWGLVAIETTLLLLIGIALARHSKDTSAWVRRINLIGVILLASSTALLVADWISHSNIQVQAQRRDLPVALPSTPGQRNPDIYYIVLDCYGRADLLHEYMGFDNQPFVEQLEQRGFFVAKNSRANYGQTVLSISSSLNFDYHDATVDRMEILVDLIQNNATVRFLKGQGYVFVNIPSHVHLSNEMHGADIVLDPSPNVLNDFERMLLSLTPAPTILRDALPAKLDAHQTQRQVVLNALVNLGSVPKIDKPKFVFAHILSPHPPFVFDEMGNLPPPDRREFTRFGELPPNRRSLYQIGYKGQVQFLNERVLEALDRILANSDPNTLPIIIIQGDHGSASCYDSTGQDPTYVRERMGILNAYLVPADLKPHLYDTISPVNSFRIIFNHFFKTDLQPLPDEARFSNYGSPFKYFTVDETGQPIATAIEHAAVAEPSGR